MKLPDQLCCPAHHLALEGNSETLADGLSELQCPNGCRFPVVKGIPRFVSSENYALAFGWQWKRFAGTQLDSVTGTSISGDRLCRCLGGDLSVVAGKTVLEAGCGAGRFTEILLDAGAEVLACDLSAAIEANFENCGGSEKYFVCQADILELPVAPQSFDIVLCLGVIQHTVNSEKTIEALANYVKPGGVLIIDHYATGYDAHWPRRIMRKLCLLLSPKASSGSALAIARALLPIHRMFWKQGRLAAIARRMVRRISPVVDYFDAYPQLSRASMEEWAILDTHNSLTNVNQNLRSIEEIRDALIACGMEMIHIGWGGNGVEARAQRPISEKDVSKVSNA